MTQMPYNLGLALGMLIKEMLISKLCSKNLRIYSDNISQLNTFLADDYNYYA